MVSLYLSLIILGLAAIDPTGIAAMPILLLQKRPYWRAATFLLGSFTSLVVMGLLFAKGLGHVVLRVERQYVWLTPVIEVGAGLLLLAVAVGAYVQLQSGKATIEPSARARRWLQLGAMQLFSFGAALVAIQSVVDVVFVVAMIRVGQYRLSNLELASALTAYALAALLLQIAVVVAFRVTPFAWREQTLQKVHSFLKAYAYQAIIVLSAVLGLVLCGLAATS